MSRRCRRAVVLLEATLVGLAFILASGLPGVAWAQLVRSGAGADAPDIAPIVNQFRLDLGGGTAAGANGLFSDATGARREINWDGVPAAFSAPNNLPANFFNVNSPRGAVFSGPGTGFQVSGATTDNLPGQPVLEFANLDPSYPATFDVFSPQRLFTALGSNIVDVNFFVPGTTTPALTRGFGSIFTDVDLANTTSISYFGVGGASLGTFFAPNVAGANETLSFLGVSFATPVITRVRITNGNAALGAGVLDQNGNHTDLVVMDDFLYGEPAAVPEPSTLILLATALSGFGIAANGGAPRGKTFARSTADRPRTLTTVGRGRTCRRRPRPGGPGRRDERGRGCDDKWGFGYEIDVSEERTVRFNDAGLAAWQAVRAGRAMRWNG